MKILELALHAFGPFTDAVLDLSAGQEGLHLIYGPNEAGKSSALQGAAASTLRHPRAVVRQLRPSLREDADRADLASR